MHWDGAKNVLRQIFKNLNGNNPVQVPLWVTDKTVIWQENNRCGRKIFWLNWQQQPNVIRVMLNKVVFVLSLQKISHRTGSTSRVFLMFSIQLIYLAAAFIERKTIAPDRFCHFIEWAALICIQGNNWGQYPLFVLAQCNMVTSSYPAAEES